MGSRRLTACLLIYIDKRRRLVDVDDDHDQSRKYNVMYYNVMCSRSAWFLI